MSKIIIWSPDAVCQCDESLRDDDMWSYHPSGPHVAFMWNEPSRRWYKWMYGFTEWKQMPRGAYLCIEHPNHEMYTRDLYPGLIDGEVLAWAEGTYWQFFDEHLTGEKQEVPNAE